MIGMSTILPSSEMAPLPLFSGRSKAAAAMNAARAAVAAGSQGKFWEMHDWLYDNQDVMIGEDPEKADEALKRAIKKMGLNETKFEEDRKSDACRIAYEQDQKDGEDIPIKGTPAMFVIEPDGKIQEITGQDAMHKWMVSLKDAK